jgi:hypothetical protein
MSDPVCSSLVYWSRCWSRRRYRLPIYAAILDGRREAAERRAAGSTPAGAAGERPSDSRASRGCWMVCAHQAERGGPPMRIAVIGAGVSGLVVAQLLPYDLAASA